MSVITKRPSTHRQLTLANGYLHGELPANTAATKLRKLGPFGELLAGEVLVDQMTTAAPYMVSKLVTIARTDYEDVISQTNNGQWRDGYDHIGSRVKAQMRLAQLETLQTMYYRKALPQRSTVENMYGKLLKYAVAAVDVSRSNRSSRLDSSIELRGSIGEFAVLLLAQRYALREIGCEDWLPLQSSFSEDQAGDCLADTGAYAWDMNIFTPALGNGFPNQTYNLQIKNYNDGRSLPPAGPTLYIRPDLALQAKEQWVGEKIIAACELEVRPSGNVDRLTQELNARTEQLLDVLG